MLITSQGKRTEPPGYEATTPTSAFTAHDRCFVCGAANAGGLKLTFERSAGVIRCRTRLDSRFQSYDGIVHGGILAAIADAAMVNLIHQAGGVRPRTCRLELRYRTPVHVGEEITAEAAVLRTKHALVWTSCSVTVESRLCVEAKAVFRIDRAGERDLGSLSVASTEAHASDPPGD